MTGIYFIYSLSCIIMDWCWPKIRAETGRCVINISIKSCWLCLEIFYIVISDTPTVVIHIKLIFHCYSYWTILYSWHAVSPCNKGLISDLHCNVEYVIQPSVVEAGLRETELSRILEISFLVTLILSLFSCHTSLKNHTGENTDLPLFSFLQ